MPGIHILAVFAVTIIMFAIGYKIMGIIDKKLGEEVINIEIQQEKKDIHLENYKNKKKEEINGQD